MSTNQKGKKASTKPPTLDDSEIVTERRVSRRSFLTRTGIIVGAASTGTSLVFSRRAAAADPIGGGSDTDPGDPVGGGSDTDPNDPVGGGSDRDGTSGRSDPPGGGSDTDPNDPVGGGSDTDPRDPHGSGTDMD